MKIEKLSKGNSKIFLAGVVITLVLVVVINLFLSYSKYKLESNIDLAEGTINYTIPDLKLMAIYIKDDSGTFKEGTIQSNTTYQVVKGEGENTSYCIDQTTGKKIDNVYMKFEDGKIDIKVDKKGTKCWVYLEKAKYLNEDILVKNPPKESTYNETYLNIAEFTKIATDDEGVFKMADYDGDPTYYFRGNVPDNYVHFAGFYWRIIRINSDGSIRMIYDGTSTHENGESSNNRQLEKWSVYNESGNDAKFVGFMYGSAAVPTQNYADAHKNEIKSTVLIKLETWYNDNIKAKNYDSYIEKDAIFCNDRRSANNYGVYWRDYLAAGSKNNQGFGNQNVTVFGPRMRIFWGDAIGWLSTQLADLSCQPNDRFTPTDARSGNKAMQYPIGLISLDELIMAGGFGGQENNKYYLYTGSYYWTLSPAGVDPNNKDSGVWYANSNGRLDSVRAANPCFIRPVINLKANTTVSANSLGTKDSPYEVI